MASYTNGIGIADHPAPIFHGLAPTFISSFSDVAGRRPAYSTCFTVYLAANIGPRRTDQLCSAVHSPMRAELEEEWHRRAPHRCGGGYRNDGGDGAAISAMYPLASCLAQLSTLWWEGGLLTQWLGWRSVFWFLAVVAAVVLVVFLIAFPETCRTIVGHGAIPPTGWNMSAVNGRQLRWYRGARPSQATGALEAMKDKANATRRTPNPADSLRILCEREVGLILLSSVVLFSGFYGINGAIPS